MLHRHRGLDRAVGGALHAAAAVLSVTVPGAGCAQIAGLTSHEPYPPDSIVQLTGGLGHACALTRSGNVWCWGANDTGQLGRPCTTPCAAGQVGQVSGAVQISAGSGFTCAVMASGKVLCWGKDDLGELGRATIASCQGGMVACDPSPGAVVGLSDAVQVSAGGNYACAVTSTGSVVCWGDNTYGQLGTGDFTSSGPSGTTRQVKGVTTAVDVSAALTGSSTCVTTSDGHVLCWGRDDQGAVGQASMPSDPMSTDMLPCLQTPQMVPGIKGPVTVHTGDQSGCVETMSGATSSFSCWGYDGLGSLGSAATGNIELPPAAVTVVPNLAALDLRDTTACGVDTAGNAWCWGQSGYGALGPEAMLGPVCDNATPCQRTAIEVGRGSVAQIATGGNLSLALLTDGTVWAWGLNSDGRLGHAPGTMKDAACLAAPMALCNGTPNQVQGLPQ